MPTASREGAGKSEAAAHRNATAYTIAKNLSRLLTGGFDY
jgi:hypothetical protein